MPSNQQAISFHLTGWTGAVTITNASAATSSVDATGTASRSAANLLNSIRSAGRSLVDSSFTWSVSTAGVVTISAGGTFALSFTGNTASRLGFAGNKTGASTYTAESACAGVFSPYAQDAFLHANDVRSAANAGVATSSGAIWMRTPKSDPKTPIVLIECVRSKTLDFIAAHSVVSSPSKVDLVDSDLSVFEYYLGGVRTSERSRIDGWGTIELAVSS